MDARGPRRRDRVGPPGSSRGGASPRAARVRPVLPGTEDRRRDPARRVPASAVASIRFSTAAPSESSAIPHSARWRASSGYRSSPSHVRQPKTSGRASTILREDASTSSAMRVSATPSPVRSRCQRAPMPVASWVRASGVSTTTHRHGREWWEQARGTRPARVRRGLRTVPARAGTCGSIVLPR